MRTLRAIFYLTWLALALFAVAYPGYSEPKGTAIEYNGSDWNQWSQDQKYFYVTGFITGQWMLSIAVESEDLGKTLESWLAWGEDIFDTVRKVDAFYAFSSNLTTPLCIVVYAMALQTDVEQGRKVHSL